MKPIVSEDFGDFLKEELDPEIENVDYDEEIVDTSDMPDMVEDEVDVEDRKDKIRIILRNELLVPEFSRETLIFMMKNSDQFEAIPMAEFPSGNTFVVNCAGENRKVKIEDIADVTELPDDDEDINEDETASGYSFDDYLKDLDAIIKEEMPTWESLLDIDDGDDPELIAWLERNQDLWDLKGKFLQEVPVEDTASDILKEIAQIEEEEDEE